MARAERARRGQVATTLLVSAILLTLMAGVLYLLAERNHHRYRLAVHAGMLRLERGLLLPLGFGPYDPQTDALRAAYAPLEIPPGEQPPLQVEPYEERGDVDRALFDMLRTWASPRLESPDAVAAELAASYVRRLEILPGLSEEQRAELRGLRAQVAFRRGAHLLDGMVTQLRQAQDAFVLSIALGSPRSAEAQRWIAEIERRLATYRDLPTADRPAPAAQ